MYSVESVAPKINGKFIKINALKKNFLFHRRQPDEFAHVVFFFFSFCQHRITTTINCLFVSVFEVSSWWTIYCSFAAPLNNLRKMKKQSIVAFVGAFYLQTRIVFIHFGLSFWCGSTQRIGWGFEFSPQLVLAGITFAYTFWSKLNTRLLALSMFLRGSFVIRSSSIFFTQKFQNNFWNHTT